MKSNVRLQTNILCEEVFDEGGRSAARASDDEICRRLSYIEFGGLNKAMPLRFSRRLWQDSIRNSGLPQDRDAFAGIDPVFFVDLDAIPDSNYGDNPFIPELAATSELDATVNASTPSPSSRISQYSTVQALIVAGHMTTALV